MLGFDDRLPTRPRRILIDGVAGSGKTTLARRVAAVTGDAYTEIDGLYHGAGWTPRPEFLDDVRRLVGEESWITEWQYRAARDILVARADLLVWLDVPFVSVTLPRVIRRTVGRRLTRVELWNGNTEPPLHTVFTDRDHIVRWSIATRHKLTERMPAVEAEHPQLPIVRLRSQREGERWLRGALADAVHRDRR